jgi:hypothetical protein
VGQLQGPQRRALDTAMPMLCSLLLRAVDVASTWRIPICSQVLICAADRRIARRQKIREWLSPFHHTEEARERQSFFLLVAHYQPMVTALS